MYLAKNRI